MGQSQCSSCADVEVEAIQNIQTDAVGTLLGSRVFSHSTDERKNMAELFAVSELYVMGEELEPFRVTCEEAELHIHEVEMAVSPAKLEEAGQHVQEVEKAASPAQLEQAELQVQEVERAASRAQLDSAAVVDCKEARAAFHVSVFRADGFALGLALECLPTALKIASVTDGGLLAAWNAAHPPNERVLVGDTITEVNGTEGDCEQLLHEIMTQKDLEMLINPRPEETAA